MPSRGIGERPSSRRGRVALLGVGSVENDMLSVAGRAELEQADVVLADSDVPPRLLELARGRLQVADKSDESTLSLDKQPLNIAALESLRRGERVVRLKSSDPFLYGRGGAELHFFRSHGFEPRLVIGACSPLVAPPVAGLPVARRGIAEQLCVVSGYTRSGALPDVPQYRLADSNLIVSMNFQ